MANCDTYTIYTCQYGNDGGAILPLTYALAWKITYDTFDTSSLKIGYRNLERY